MRVGKLSLGTTGSLDLSGSTVSLNGGIDASLSAYAHATIKKASPTAPVVVTVGTFDVALETATGKFTDAQANAIFALAAGYLRNTVEQMVKSALGGALQGSLPKALESVFESLDTALANRSFNVDAAPLPKVALTLDGHLNEIVLAPFDSMRAKLSLAVKTDHASAVHPKSRGVALVDTSTADAFFASPRAQLSVRLAVLNGLLHNLWNSGLLEIPKSDSIPLSVSAQLPPIVRLPREGETDDLVVSLGELEMLPGGDEANGRLGVLLEAGVSIELADDTLRLKLADKPVVTVWTIKEPPGHDPLHAAAHQGHADERAVAEAAGRDHERALDQAAASAAGLARERGAEPVRARAPDGAQSEGRVSERVPRPRCQDRGSVALNDSPSPRLGSVPNCRSARGRSGTGTGTGTGT